MKKLLFFLILFPTLTRAQVDESLRIDGAGLVANRVTDHLGEIPVTVAYLRADFPRRDPVGNVTNPDAVAMLRENLEPARGEYHLQIWQTLLDRAETAGIQIGFRVIAAIHPKTSYGYPAWMKTKTVTRNSETGRLPDWNDASVQAADRALLAAIGQVVRNHPAFLFMDLGIIGVTSEWHTHWGVWFNSDFMPSIEVQKRYVDWHIEAFGADRLVINLTMPAEVQRYALSRGVKSWRGDGFGGTHKMSPAGYASKFNAVPELLEVAGHRFLEIWGGHMSAWADLQARGEVVNWPIDQIFDKALQWKATLYYNMGWELPEVYVGAYKDFQRAMMEYIDAPLPGPGPVPSDTTFVLLGGAVIDSVLVWPGDVTWQHPCVGGVNRCKLPSGGRLWIAPTRGDFEGWGGADADLVEQRGSTWTFNTSGRTNIFIEAVYPDAPVPEPVTGEVIALLEAIQLQLMTLEEAVQQIREAQRRAAQAILEEE